MHVCTSETTSLTSSHRGASANFSRQRPQTLNGKIPTRLSYPAQHSFFYGLSLSLSLSPFLFLSLSLALSLSPLQ